MSSSTLVERVQFNLQTILSETFPQKEITISSEDQPYFNESLRHLKRQRLREYNRHGRSVKYLNIMKTFSDKLEKEKLKYLEKIEKEVSEGKRGSSYPTLKKLGMRPGESTHMNVFILPDHAEQNLSPTQSAELIADYF